MLSPSRDCDQSNVLPSSSETGIGTRPGDCVSSFDIVPPVLISDQLRLVNPIGGFDLFTVKCAIPQELAQRDDQSLKVTTYPTRPLLDQPSLQGWGVAEDRNQISTTIQSTSTKPNHHAELGVRTISFRLKTSKVENPKTGIKMYDSRICGCSRITLDSVASSQ